MAPGFKLRKEQRWSSPPWYRYNKPWITASMNHAMLMRTLRLWKATVEAVEAFAIVFGATATATEDARAAIQMRSKLGDPFDDMSCIMI